MAERVVIGDCTLYQGDCRMLLDRIPVNASIVSDPPYGIAYRRGRGGGGRHHRRHENAPIVGDDAPFDPAPLLRWPCVLFGADHYAQRLPAGGSMHVWDKHCGRGPNDNYADVEFFWTSWKRKAVVVRHAWKGVIRDSENGQPRLHVSQKPVPVMEECVRMAPDLTVCDPYMGSAATGIACVRLNRPFIGVELDEAHFATAVRRIEAAYRQGDMLMEVA